MVKKGQTVRVTRSGWTVDGFIESSADQGIGIPKPWQGLLQTNHNNSFKKSLRTPSPQLI